MTAATGPAAKKRNSRAPTKTKKDEPVKIPELPEYASVHDRSLCWLRDANFEDMLSSLTAALRSKMQQKQKRASETMKQAQRRVEADMDALQSFRKAFEEEFKLKYDDKISAMAMRERGCLRWLRGLTAPQIWRKKCARS